MEEYQHAHRMMNRTLITVGSKVRNGRYISVHDLDQLHGAFEAFMASHPLYGTRRIPRIVSRPAIDDVVMEAAQTLLQIHRS